MKTLLTLGVFAVLLAPSALSAAEKSVDPEALAHLKRMSATLAAAKAFTYKSHAIIEVPASTGQFLTLFSDAEVAMQRPNKLRATLAGEAPAFDFYYDGETAAAYAPGTHTFSSAKAPSTIDAMLPELETETGIRFITAPLLFTDPYSVITRDLTSGVIVGPAEVRGVDCIHLAFRAPGVNWEIWIETGSKALPRRLAVTFTDQPNFPRNLVEFSQWNLNPWLRAGDFTFTKPDGAHEIPFLAVWKSTGR